MRRRARDSAGRREGRSSGPAFAPRVVVASDNPDVLAVAEHVLSALGCRVTTTKAGLGVVEHLADGPPRGLGPGRVRLLVLDGVDEPWVALSLVEGLRSARRRIPVLLILDGDPEYSTRANQLRIDGVVRPPVTHDALERAAARILFSGRGPSIKEARATVSEPVRRPRDASASALDHPARSARPASSTREPKAASGGGARYRGGD